MAASSLARGILQDIAAFLQAPPARTEGATRRNGDATHNLSSNIQHLYEQACTSGLDHTDVSIAYELAFSGAMTPDQADKLLACVLPRGPVSTNVVLAIVSVSGSSRATPSVGKDPVDFGTQRFALFQLASFLRTKNVSVEARAALHSLYAVIEAGLAYGTLREPTAAILAELGEAQDVQLHRLDKLQQLLTSDDGAQPESVVRLLDEYRSRDSQRVYPSPGEVVALKPQDATTDFERWSLDYLRLCGSLAPMPLASKKPAQFAFSLDEHILPQDPLQLLETGARRKTPRVRPKDPVERTAAWANVLHVGFENDFTYLHRCSYLANAQLLRNIHHGESAESIDAVAELLSDIRDVSILGGELLEEVEPLLADYLTKWDGISHQHLVFELIALLKPFDVASLEKYYLKPLRTLSASASATIEWRTGLVRCLRELVMGWASRDDWAVEASRTTVFGALDSHTDYVESLQHLLQFATDVIESAVLRYSQSLVLRAAALDFYESALNLPLQLGLPVLTLPSPSLTYVCLLSTEAASLSQICGIIGSLREALTGPNSALDKENDHSSRLVISLNRVIVDFVNTLWQKRLLKSQGQIEAFGLNSDEIEVLRDYAQTRTAAGSGSLGLTTHPALAKLARTCLEVLAEQSGKRAAALEGPVTAASLKDLAGAPDAIDISLADFRPRFLEWGKTCGLDGLAELLFASLASLLAFRVSQDSQMQANE